MKLKVPLYLLLVMAGFVVILNCFEEPPKDMSQYIKIGSEQYKILLSKRDTIWMPGDTIKVSEYVPVPGPIVEVEVPADVDTVAILKDYFSKSFYKDVVLLDSIGTAEIYDTITQNKISSRRVNFNYKIPVIIDSIVVEAPRKAQVYLGGGGEFTFNTRFHSVYAGALLKGKKDNILTIGVGVSGSYSGAVPYFGIGFYKPLNLKK